MKVSIIIPAWHEEKTIVRTLNTLKQLNYSLRECEVIIAASADDGTYAIAKRKDMSEFGRYIVLKQEPGGKNAALQQGIKASEGELIVLLDADTLVDKGWLSEMIEPIKSGKAVCTNGNYFPLSSSWINNSFMIDKVLAKQFINQQSTTGGGGIAFKRQLLKEIGINNLFNKEISAGVDYNFGNKIFERGHKTYFVEKAKIRTFFKKTLKGYIKDNIREKNALFSLSSKFLVFKIFLFNFVIISSLILFIFASLLSNKFIFYLPFIAYSFYTLFQCIVSACISSKLSLLFYFPIYLLISLINRALIIYVFFRRIIGLEFSRNTHFKGERYN
jgi:cellulose synthase/poly-beta-1,6-N-acetylglucosamine synthase-like glycosyltransferase